MEKPINILYVEDEEDLAVTFGRVLQGAGYAPEFCYDGLSAYNRIFHPGEKPQPKACISDRNMPGMKGDELAGKIKESFPNLEVILFCGDKSAEDEELKAKGVKIILKPNIDEVLDCLNKSFPK